MFRAKAFFSHSRTETETPLVGDLPKNVMKLLVSFKLLKNTAAEHKQNQALLLTE